MPLSPDIKRQILLNKGLNPDQFIIDDSGFIYDNGPVRKPQPASSSDNVGQFLTNPDQRNVPEASPSSAMAVAGKAALKSTIPTIGALGVGALAAAPFTGGTSLAIPILAGLAGSIAGGYGASKLQEKVIPQNIQDAYFPSAEDVESHKTANLIGSTIPSALAFSPTRSIQNLVGGVKGLGSEIATGTRSLTDAQRVAAKALLLNSGINAGVGAGMNIYNQNEGGAPFDYGSLALETGVAGLLNAPRKPFQRFFGDTTIPEAPVKGMIPQGYSEPIGPVRPDYYSSANQSRPALDYNDPISGLLNAPRFPAESFVPTETTIPQQGLLPYNEVIKGLLTAPRRFEAGETAGNTRDLQSQLTDVEIQRANSARMRAEDFKKAQEELANEQLKAAQLEVEKQKTYNLASQNTLRITQEALKKNLSSGGIARPEARPNVEGRELPISAEAPLTEAEQIQQEYDLGKRRSTETPISPDAAEITYQKTKTQGQALAEKRGNRIGTEGTIPTAGEFEPSNRQINIGPVGKRGGDTLPHEVTHSYMLDLARSNDPRDHALLEKGLRAATGKSVSRDEYLKLNKDLEDTLYSQDTTKNIELKKKLADIEEPLAKEIGVRGYQRFTYNPKRQFVKDVVTNFKNKLGLADDQAVLDYFSSNLHREAPYGTREKHLPTKAYAPQERKVETGVQLQRSGTEEKRTQAETSLGDSVQGEERKVVSKEAGVEHPKELHAPNVNNQLNHETNNLVKDDILTGSKKSTDASYRKPSDVQLQSSDRAAYEDVQNRLMEAFAKHKDVNHPEVNALWKESEAIKNRHGGMPPADEARHQEHTALTDDTNVPKGPLKFFSSDLDTLRSKGGTYKHAANALDETLNVARANMGKYETPMLEAAGKISKKKLQEVYKNLIEEDHAQKVNPPAEGTKEREVYDALRATYKKIHEDQRAANQPVKTSSGEYRLPESHDYSWFNVPSHKVIETINSNVAGNKEFDALKKDFIDHYEAHGKSLSQAEEAFNEIKAQYGGSGHKTNFGAVRREEGVGLPMSWIEPDALTAIKRYINRVSRDRAWHDVIESDASLNKLFGNKVDPWGEGYEDYKEGDNLISDPVVRRATQQVVGFKDYSRKTKLEAFTRPVSSLLLGPLTGIGDVVSSVSGMLKYVKPHQVPEVLASYSKALDKYKTTLETGLNRKNLSSLYEVTQLSSSFEDKLNSLSDAIYKLSGRDFLEKTSRSFTQAAGETIALIKRAEASEGDKGAESFLRMLSNDRDYNDLSIQELGTRIAQRQQGTYDVRQLPYWAIDSSVSPFLKLARWNLGQANEFAKSVVNQAMSGNINPLITSLFGSTAAGYIIKELREKVSNKKDTIPSLTEIASGDKENKISLYSWNVAGALAYAGFGGMLGDITKSVMDVAHRNKPQGFTFPTIELGADIASKSFHAAEAIANGEDILEVARQFTSDSARQHIQILRLLSNNADKILPESNLARDNSRTEYRNDLRRYKQVTEGEDVTPLSGRGLFEDNPYLDLKSKKFKRTSDISEAVGDLPELLSNALEKAQGNPYRLKEELRKLKANNYQTMPSPEEMPMSFASYLGYLTKTQGADKASERLYDYLKQREINKAKSSLVPSL